MTALDMLPRCMQTPAVRQVVDALLRGDVLMLPMPITMIGDVVERLAHVARMVNAQVIVCPDIGEVTTRERVDA